MRAFVHHGQDARATSGFVDHLPVDGLGEGFGGLFEVSVAGYAVPAPVVPLCEELFYVAGGFYGEFCSAGAVVGVVVYGFSLVDDDFLLVVADFECCGEVAEGEYGADAGALSVFGVGHDFPWVGRAGGAEHAVGGDAVGVDDLAFGGVDDGVGDEAGSAAGEVVDEEHRGGRADVAFAGADEAFVAEFVEAEAGVGVDVAAVEAAEAVDGDGVGVVVGEDFLHAEVHGGGGFEGGAGDVEDFGGVLLPAVGDGAGLVLVGGFPCGVDFGKGDVFHWDAHDGGGGAGVLAADGEDFGGGELLDAFFGGDGFQRVGGAGEVAGGGGGFHADGFGCGGEGVGCGFGGGEAFDGGDEVGHFG